MAVEDRIELSSADMPITLSCVPIPGSEFDIDYCRWIKPDGTIVQSEVDAENSNETNHQYCRMTITGKEYKPITTKYLFSRFYLHTGLISIAHIFLALFIGKLLEELKLNHVVRFILKKKHEKLNKIFWHTFITLL